MLIHVVLWYMHPFPTKMGYDWNTCIHATDYVSRWHNCLVLYHTQNVCDCTSDIQILLHFFSLSFACRFFFSLLLLLFLNSSAMIRIYLDDDIYMYSNARWLQTLTRKAKYTEGERERYRIREAHAMCRKVFKSEQHSQHRALGVCADWMYYVCAMIVCISFCVFWLFGVCTSIEYTYILPINLYASMVHGKRPRLL